jgi:hypothetical protein
MRQLRAHVTVLLFLAFCSAMSMGCRDRETTLVIEKPTEAHGVTQASSARGSGPSVQPGNLIATLKVMTPDDKVTIDNAFPDRGFKP